MPPGELRGLNVPESMTDAEIRAEIERLDADSDFDVDDYEADFIDGVLSRGRSSFTPKQRDFAIRLIDKWRRRRT